MDLKRLVDTLADRWAELNRDNEFWREPPLGLDSFLEYAADRGWVPDGTDLEDLRNGLDSYL